MYNSNMQKKRGAGMQKLPAGADFVLERLARNGYQGYVVGGCVRDSLLGREPKDWDICTDALPEQMQRVFGDQHVIETGLQHGTLTVMYDHEPYEVTTFRVDGEYTDHRHPDQVTFVADVREDLARRDFTINAMAWNPHTGLVDAFGGQEDLAAGVIRCVGDPYKRFEEDALRIMRAMRFASVYGFRIDLETDAAIHALKHTLIGVAAERIRVELAKLLCGAGAGEILRRYRDVIFTLFPQLSPMDGFDQRTHHHLWDVWEHTVRAVEAVPPTEVLRLTMLLHDTGKPECFTLDESGEGHAYGHEERSVRIADKVLADLKVDNATRDRALQLIGSHGWPVTPDRQLLKRRLNRLGEEALRQLIEVKRADALATGTKDNAAVEKHRADTLSALETLLAERPCVTLRDMAVNGRDVMALGAKGRAVGETLGWLLDQLLDDVLPNDRETLLEAAKAHLAAETHI